MDVAASAETAVADLIVAGDCCAERIAVAGGFEVDRAGLRTSPEHGVRLIGGGRGLTDLNEARDAERAGTGEASGIEIDDTCGGAAP